MPWPLRPHSRLILGFLAAGLVLTGILAAVVIPYGNDERTVVRQKIIERAADILYPEALQQVAESEAANPGADPEDLLWPVTKTANQKGMLAVTVFDAQGEALHSVPDSLLLPEIPAPDFAQLLAGQPISRYYPAFPVAKYFSGVAGSATAPVLEVLLALTGRDPSRIVGFVQYYIYANSPNTLAGELAQVDGQIYHTTVRTLLFGLILIAAVLAASYAGLSRAMLQLEERNRRLLRANFELTLASKVSALGQITSHLIHGLQGPVAGLIDLTAQAEAGNAESGGWHAAAGYAARLQAMIQETVGILADLSGQVGYECPASEVADAIRVRNESAAADRGIAFSVAAPKDVVLDSRQASLLSLIATNLAQNAIAATPAGGAVRVTLEVRGDRLVVTVQDEGGGIAPAVRERLFQPGATGRPGGTGLGLAISRLLARQMGGEMELRASGPHGTLFEVNVPRAAEFQKSNSTSTGQ